MQITKLLLDSPEYPDNLKHIAQPPKTIFVAGEIPLEPAVAIVGPRKPTTYGEEITYQLAYDLAKAGIAIVSGLAVGIDTIAHRAALDAGGKTVGVLGCGLDINYPASNRYIKEKMIERGAVVSEYPLGTPPAQFRFPARNRIVAGLSQAVIVTEAPVSSGSLITADLALDNGRLVMAVPGNVDRSTSSGSNNLLRKGAIAITSAVDVLEVMKIPGMESLPPIKATSKEEAAIMALIVRGIKTTEEMIRHLDMPAAQFAQMISLMEISGKVRNLGAGHWSLGR